MRRRKTRVERLESRKLLTAYINEILYSELFGDSDSSQYVELRGEPNNVLADGTYLVVVESEDTLNNLEGQIHGIFDLSGQSFGSNGFLVLLPQGSPYQPHSAARTLRSTTAGFGNLPGDIYQDSHDLSDRIDYIFAANTFFLIQTDTPPQLGDDIDADSDGFVDPDGIIANWNVLDSISTMWSLGDSHGYGSIVFVNTNSVHHPNVTAPESTPIVRLDGFGYVGRIGNSRGSTPEDWVSGTVKDLDNDQYFVRLAGDIHGRPARIVFQGRELDSVGSENFTGASRLRFFQDLNGNGVFDLGEPPLTGGVVFADSNCNGTRDLIETVIEPDDFAEDLELNNLTPGVSLSTAVDANEIIGFSIQAEQLPFAVQGERVFAHTGIPFFNSTRRFRADFYRPATSVSIDFIGDSNTTPTYGRLEAYDAENNLIQMLRTGPLGSLQTQRLSITADSDSIAYAIAYPDENFLNSSPFGRLDRFAFTVPESTGVVDDEGLVTLNYLDPGQYTIIADASVLDDFVFGRPSFEITNYENFDFEIPTVENVPPVINDASLSVAENSSAGTVVGTVTASDHPSQSVRFSLLNGGDRFAIDAVTGTVRVRAGVQLDHESTPSVTIRVRATDNSANPLSSTRDFQVSITDVNETPNLPSSQLQVPENSSKGTVIGTVKGTDVDSGDNGLLGYRISGTNPGQAFTINGITGELSVNTASYFDFEARSQIVVSIEVFDAGDPSLTDSANVTVLLENVNEAPRVVTTQLGVGELVASGDVVGKVQVSDPEPAQFHLFEWADGFTTSLFTIDPDSGEIRVATGAQLSFADQPQHTVSIKVTDSGFPALSSTADITITVIDENNPPAIQPIELSIDENTAGEVALGTVSVEDPDIGQTHVYAIAGGSGASLFSIGRNNGVITTKEDVEFDYESNNSYTLTIQAWDSGLPSASSTREFTVIVNDINEPPTVLSENQFEIGEDALAGSMVGQVPFADPDNGDQPLILLVQSEDSSLFTIDSQTGVISLAPETSLDFELKSEYQLTVEVSDGVNDPVTAAVTVAVLDRNEPPQQVAEVDPIQVLAGYGISYSIPEDAVTDPDTGQNLTWTLTKDEAELPSWLSFDPETRLITGQPWNAQQGSHQLTLTVTDDGLPTASIEIPITIVVEVNATPWTNIGNNNDVDGDGDVRAIDALVVINFLNRSTDDNVPEDVDFRPAFLDVNGNNKVEPIDALKVINFLNRGGEGEGERSFGILANHPLVNTLATLDESDRRRVRNIDEAIRQLF